MTLCSDRTINNACSNSEDWDQEAGRRKGVTIKKQKFMFNLEDLVFYYGKLISALEKHDCISKIDFFTCIKSNETY